MLDSSGKCTLKYNPETLRCQSSTQLLEGEADTPSRLRTFTTRLLQLLGNGPVGNNELDEEPPVLQQLLGNAMHWRRSHPPNTTTTQPWTLNFGVGYGSLTSYSQSATMYNKNLFFYFPFICITYVNPGELDLSWIHRTATVLISDNNCFYANQCLQNQTRDWLKYTGWSLTRLIMVECAPIRKQDPEKLFASGIFNFFFPQLILRKCDKSHVDQYQFLFNPCRSKKFNISECFIYIHTQLHIFLSILV